MRGSSWGKRAKHSPRIDIWKTGSALGWGSFAPCAYPISDIIADGYETIRPLKRIARNIRNPLSVSTSFPKRCVHMDSPDQVELKEIEGRFEVAVNQFHPTPDLPIFLRPDFFKLHSSGARKAFHFQMCAKESAKVIAAAAFYGVEPHRYVSPWRGSFGALFFTDRTLPLAANDFFLDCIETRLQQEGAKEISMVLPPQAYYPEMTSVLVNLLLRKGYKLTRHELNYSRVITDEDFLSSVNKGNRKNIRRAAKRGFVFQRMTPVEIGGAYEIIAENRERRDYPITMTLEQIEVMLQAIPGSLVPFSVTDGSKMIAASICIAVDQAVLYVFYWGEIDGYQNPSPIPFLAQGLYSHCQENGFRLMDVGTATVEGNPNHGLIRFKRSLGLAESLKLTFSKTFAC